MVKWLAYMVQVVEEAVAQMELLVVVVITVVEVQFVLYGEQDEHSLQQVLVIYNV
jgi:hypothetical protein